MPDVFVLQSVARFDDEHYSPVPAIRGVFTTLEKAKAFISEAEWTAFGNDSCASFQAFDLGNTMYGTVEFRIFTVPLDME